MSILTGVCVKLAVQSTIKTVCNKKVSVEQKLELSTGLMGHLARIQTFFVEPGSNSFITLFPFTTLERLRPYGQVQFEI